MKNQNKLLYYVLRRNQYFLYETALVQPMTDKYIETLKGKN